ncbi:hypothetical protein R1flu_010051 [Riccia fluitans]|uniref:ribonuclease H n=1 Tax=Riccia fluitans TaxID=41844 RepID=A0ABD1Z3X1_9MARC
MVEYENPRIYNPYRGNAVYCREPEEVIYDESTELAYLRYRWVEDRRRKPRTLTDRGQAVVAIDGACRGNGTVDARAAYGVYFGPDSSLNAYGLLPWDERQTSQNAEIYAARIALDCIEDLEVEGVTIITDSSYLVKGMTEHIHEWLENDFCSSGRTCRIVNADGMRSLNEAI